MFKELLEPAAADVITDTPNGVFNILRSKWLARAGAVLGGLALAFSVSENAVQAEPAARANHGSKESQSLIVGAFDDAAQQPSSRDANKVMRSIAGDNFGLVKQEVRWDHLDELKLSPNDDANLRTSITAATNNNLGIDLMFLPHTWEEPSILPPLRPNQQRNFCDFVSNVVSEFPQVRMVQIGNEENNPLFWPNQFKPDGTDAVATPYEALLARCYDEVKAINPDIKVVGAGLASSGNDDPHSGRPSLSPTTFIRDLGAAYAASGRILPIMDAFGMHPYFKNGDSLMTVHPDPDTTIGLADYPKLVQALGNAFNGPNKQQLGANLPVIYDEFAEQTSPPASEAYAYSGTKPSTVNLVTEASQAQDYETFLQTASCQRTVIGAILFKEIDGSNIANDYQSGLKYASGKPKSSAQPVSQAIQDAQAGSAIC